MAYSKDCYRGKYVPRNPSKYIGDINDITYRSSYEKRFMKWLDMSKNVISWGSETIVVPYVSPLDGALHRYFTDFVMKINTKNGVKTYLVEIKPSRFTKEPVVPKRKTQHFITEVKQWAVNNAKWDAARKFASQRNWEFMLVTEIDLGSLA